MESVIFFKSGRKLTWPGDFTKYMKQLTPAMKFITIEDEKGDKVAINIDSIESIHFTKEVNF